jgi:hypothetical protein
LRANLDASASFIIVEDKLVLVFSFFLNENATSPNFFQLLLSEHPAATLLKFTHRDRGLGQHISVVKF